VEFHDISVAIHPRMPVWAGDPPITLTRVASIERGDGLNVSRLELGAHTGTHIDAPVHFVAGRRGIDQLDLATLIGPACVAELDVAHEITAEDLQRLRLPPDTTRLLFKTGNSQYWLQRPAEFVQEFIGLRADAARWIVEHGIRLVGVDYLGVERYEMIGCGAPVHHILLEAEVVIIEGLNLAHVSAGCYTLVCLPIKILDSDGAPCRAVLIDE
jgi:arylformamidase